MNVLKLKTDFALNGNGKNETEEANTKPAFALPAWARKLMPGAWSWNTPFWMGSVSILPEAAAVILAEHHARNRNIIQSQLDDIVRAMQTGQFQLNGDTIKFTRSGFGVDLQHRLTACVITGIPLRTCVVFGVADEAFTTYDQHGIRPLEQILQMQEEANPRETSGALNFIHYFMHTGVVVRGQAKKLHLTKRELMDGLNKFPALRESVSFAVQYKKQAKKFVSPNLLASLHWILSQADANLANEFFVSLLENSVPKGSKWAPVSVLSTRLEENLGRRKLPRGFTEAYTVKAWNALRNETNVERLRFDKREGFPRVSGWTYDENNKPVLK